VGGRADRVAHVVQGVEDRHQVVARAGIYLLAQVATGPAARAAVDRIAATLPRVLRTSFLERGRLASAASRA